MNGHLLTIGAPLMSDSSIKLIAKKYGVSTATVLISYHVNKGTVVIPKSVNQQRISENRKAIAISREDIEKLDGLSADGKAQRINTHLWGWDLGFDDWYKPE